MNETNQILEHLRSHRDDLKRMHVAGISIFGSAARGEMRADSDIDLLVEFDRPIGLFHFVRVKNLLEKYLGRPVDLVTKDALRPEMKDSILKETIRAA